MSQTLKEKQGNKQRSEIELLKYLNLKEKNKNEFMSNDNGRDRLPSTIKKQVKIELGCLQIDQPAVFTVASTYKKCKFKKHRT